MPKRTKEPDNTFENIKNYLLSPIKGNKTKNKTQTESAKTKVNSKKVEKKSAKAPDKTSSIKKSSKVATSTRTSATNSSTKKVESNKQKLVEEKSSSLAVSKAQEKNDVKKEEKEKISTPKIKKFSPEYYDLPYKYNKTVVKILAQTPTHLFVYWEISDDDREKLKEQYGDYFFEITKPVLIIHNKTMNYSFEIDINDFANSWYFNVNDSNCEYQIELGRRPIPINYSYIPNYNVEEKGQIKPVESPYIYISSSNNLEAPNDHVLFNNSKKIYFRNVKTNQIIEKDIKDFPHIFQNDEFISIYKLYENLYKDEIFNGHFKHMNPSSGNPSSGNLSSW